MVEEGSGPGVNRFRAGLVFKAHRRVYHSTLGSRVIKKKGMWAWAHRIPDLQLDWLRIDRHPPRPELHSCPRENIFIELPNALSSHKRDISTEQKLCCGVWHTASRHWNRRLRGNVVASRCGEQVGERAPIVRSCTGWKRLSVNCSSKHDFPTPAHSTTLLLQRLAAPAGQHPIVNAPSPGSL